MFPLSSVGKLVYMFAGSKPNNLSIPSYIKPLGIFKLLRQRIQFNVILCLSILLHRLLSRVKTWWKIVLFTLSSWKLYFFAVL